MIGWWQHIPEHIGSTAISFGGFPVSWYGIMFLLGAVSSLLFLRYSIRRTSPTILSCEEFFDLSLFLLFGAILGARLGYAFFYNADFFLAHPLALVSPIDPETGKWTGIAGMSAHGGVIGLVFAAFLFSRWYRKPLPNLLDGVAVSIPIAIFFGRLGNFLTGELFGRQTTVPWGMVFPRAGDLLLRHPSELYEAFGEGIVLWLVLFILSKRAMAPSRISVWALLLYGGIRFFLEFFREPDDQIGFVLGFFTLGQVLSVGMIALALVFLWWSGRGKNAILSHTK